MRKIFLLIVFIPLFLYSSTNEFKKFKIKDQNGEEIPGASISIIETNVVLYSNLSGEFEIPVYFSQRDFTIEVNSISYQSEILKLKDIKSSIILKFR
jgi:hypothetical protein